MAFLLVPVATVKAALRIDTTDDDAVLELYTSAASRAVVEYMKGEAGDFFGIDSPPNSPPDDLTTVDERARLAVIALAGVFYREPDGDIARNFNTHGMLPNFVTALLYPLRHPTLA